MKNLFVLSTDKPSKLGFDSVKNLHFVNDYIDDYQNIYITSDETSYPYALHITKQEVLKVRAVGKNSGELYHDKGFSYPEECKKIILTDNKDLIKDGVQAIDDTFLEWFIKNSSCEEVEVVSEQYTQNYHKDIWYSRYKIIIPKEELKSFSDFSDKFFGSIPKEELKQEYEYIGECKGNNDDGCFMNSSGHNCNCFLRIPKQETIEEFAERLYSDKEYPMYGEIRRDAFIEGAKWQQKESQADTRYLIDLLKQTTEYEVLQSFKDKVNVIEKEQERSYSEEEVLNKLTHFAVEIQRQNKKGVFPLRIKEWFERNKKK